MSIQFLAMELLTLTVGAFSNDVYRAEPTPLATSGFWLPKRLAGLLGSPTSDKKDQPPREHKHCPPGRVHVPTSTVVTKGISLWCNYLSGCDMQN